MNTDSFAISSARETPWHIWVVGILALLWNAAGAYTILMAQAGRLADLSAEEQAYYAAQPLWFVAVTDLALFAAIVAAVAILLRRRAAVVLFAVSLASIVITNAYDLAHESSRALYSGGALAATSVIFVLAVLELVYASSMAKRAVLR